MRAPWSFRLDDLLRKRHDEEDLVFTHGDYCLPNVIIDGEEVAGFVDWGRAGKDFERGVQRGRRPLCRVCEGVPHLQIFLIFS